MRLAAERLSAVFRKAKPGAVIIVAQVWAMEWVSLADTTGIPVIGMSHESYGASRASSRHARVKRLFANADRLLLLTQEDADAWAREGLGNVGSMPNALPIEPTHVASLDEKVVVSLGRLSYEKGYDLLLEAWRKVFAQHPDWTLRIYGVGDELPALRSQARESGIESAVDFAGQTDDVEGALRGTSVFALASRAEGFPLSLLEAMVCGIPCVAFDCAAGVREIIRDEEDGLLATAGNVDRFADQLTRLLDDEELRRDMGARARENVQRYSSETILARWENVFTLVHR